MLEKQKLYKDYMQDFEFSWKLCDAPFLALQERESRRFNDESTSICLFCGKDLPLFYGILLYWLSAEKSSVFRQKVFFIIYSLFSMGINPFFLWKNSLYTMEMLPFFYENLPLFYGKTLASRLQQGLPAS